MKPRFPTTVAWSCLAACLTTTALGIVATAVADEMPSHGEMAAAIRSANLPCAHVLQVEPAGEQQWSVRCNSGGFLVTRGQDGQFSVEKSD